MRPSYARNVVRCVLVALTSLVMLGLSSRAGAESPFGLPKRVPWNSKRLMGSPEPPLPYTVEKTFTKLTWKTPIYLADEQGTDHLWVIQEGVAAEQGSRIVRIKDDPDTTESELILELPKYLVYSVCFHPDYLSNGYVYLFRNGPRSAPERMNQIIRYTVDRQAPHKIVPMSEELILEWQSSGHDGGDMTFGRDGMFYITTGDGSSDSDTYVSGQTLNDLLGSVLRIDVNKRVGKQPYAVPSDNPFISTPGLDRKSGPMDYGTPGAWAVTRRPARSGSGPTARTSGKPPISSVAVRITAGASMKGATPFTSNENEGRRRTSSRPSSIPMRSSAPSQAAWSTMGTNSLT